MSYCGRWERRQTKKFYATTIVGLVELVANPSNAQDGSIKVIYMFTLRKDTITWNMKHDHLFTIWDEKAYPYDARGAKNNQVL